MERGQLKDSLPVKGESPNSTSATPWASVPGSQAATKASHWARWSVTMSGRPEKEIVDSYRLLLTKWIDSNLVNPEEDPYCFEGTLLLHKK